MPGLKRKILAICFRFDLSGHSLSLMHYLDQVSVSLIEISILYAEGGNATGSQKGRGYLYPQPQE